MKLSDLFEEDKAKAAPDILESYRRARKLKSYAAILKLGFTDASGPIQLGRGVFQFEEETRSQRYGLRYYTVQPYGTIRYNAGSTQTSEQKVPNLTKKNWLEDYNRMLERVIEIETAKAANKNSPKPKTYDDAEKSWEFTDKDEVFMIHDDKLSKLPSDQKIVISYTLSNLPNLETLEGGPAQISGKTATLQKLALIKTLKGFPKPERELAVWIQDCPRLVSLEGLECTHLKLRNLKALTSLEGLGLKFGKNIESIAFYKGVNIKSNIMGLAAMPHLKEVDFPDTTIVDLPDWAVQLVRVVKNFEPSDRLIELQHALLDAKLDDYAKP